ncbi:OPT oligopeptide transporter protein-domain-containing protein [Gautieria morchelliformis]|nr:OPT oligopeptide transporter protein-domain-containing protein [Gautieria morchelliformis]
MWVIGLVLCVIASGMNVFFNFRNPAPTVIPIVLVLLSYPTGKLAAYVLPIVTYRIRLPRFLGGPLEFSLNPGPWNIKEHVLVFIMSNGEPVWRASPSKHSRHCTVAISAPFAMNAIVVGEVYYNIRLGFWFNLTLILATQLTGFGLAGLCRRLLVYPASMVWPQNLVACTLLNTLHAEDDATSGGITRYRFFMWVVAGSFAFFFLPGFLFTALSVFSWVCWIVPKNVPANQLFGVSSGLGMGILTFDWTQIVWVGSPLMMPWWAEVHVFVGFVLFFWIITPLLYYTNVWKLSYFPMADSMPFDRFGNQYDVTRVLTADNRFNVTAYEEYSPLYLPATYAVTYVLALALFTCVIVHTLLYHGHSLWNGFKRLKVEPDDIHAKLMSHYPEVPDWWYLSVFLLFFCLAIVAVEVWHTNVPIWALMLALVLPIVYVLPSGFIFAMTGQPITLNLPAQILPGLLLPGNPLANMVFKSYSVQTLNEAINFTQDLKLGHYIKVPPRATFQVQAVATVIAAFVQVGVKEWMFKNIPGICEPTQKSSLTCPHNQVFFTASAIWGLIGPQRQFGDQSIYNPQLYALLIGAILPVPFWLWQRRFPKTRLKFINIPVVLNGVQWIPPATGINYSSWFAVGFVFQYLIRRRSFPWWSKFNYVTSAALDCGTTISLMIIFFTLQFPRGGVNLNWWGNNVYKNTADFQHAALRQVPPGGIIQ